MHIFFLKDPSEYNGFLENILPEVEEYVKQIQHVSEDCSDEEKRKINGEILSAIMEFTELAHNFCSGDAYKKYLELVDFDNLSEEAFNELADIICKKLTQQDNTIHKTAHITLWHPIYEVLRHGNYAISFPLLKILNEHDESVGALNTPKYRIVERLIKENEGIKFDIGAMYYGRANKIEEKKQEMSDYIKSDSAIVIGLIILIVLVIAFVFGSKIYREKKLKTLHFCKYPDCMETIYWNNEYCDEHEEYEGVDEDYFLDCYDYDDNYEYTDNYEDDYDDYNSGSYSTPKPRTKTPSGGGGHSSYDNGYDSVYDDDDYDDGRYDSDSDYADGADDAMDDADW